MSIRQFFHEFRRLFDLAMQAPESEYKEGYIDALHEVSEIAQESLGEQP